MLGQRNSTCTDTGVGGGEARTLALKTYNRFLDQYLLKEKSI